MNKVRLLGCIIGVLFVAVISSSALFGAEILSQSELDDLISRVEKRRFVRTI